MEDKHKVTLYLPSETHRQLKVKAALDDTTMSLIVERALQTYLISPEESKATESYGNVYQVYSCPKCATSLVVDQGSLMTPEERSKRQSNFEDVGNELLRNASVVELRGEEKSGAVVDNHQEELVSCI